MYIYIYIYFINILNNRDLMLTATSRWGKTAIMVQEEAAIKVPVQGERSRQKKNPKKLL